MLTYFILCNGRSNQHFSNQKLFLLSWKIFSLTCFSNDYTITNKNPKLKFRILYWIYRFLLQVYCSQISHANQIRKSKIYKKHFISIKKCTRMIHLMAFGMNPSRKYLILVLCTCSPARLQDFTEGKTKNTLPYFCSRILSLCHLLRFDPDLELVLHINIYVYV